MGAFLELFRIYLGIYTLHSWRLFFPSTNSTQSQLNSTFPSCGLSDMPPTKVTKKKTSKRMLIHTILDIHSQAHKLSFAQLKASLANLTSMVQGDQFERPRLAISSLKLRDIQVMLKLSLSPNDLEFRNRTPVELSPIYGTCPLGNVQANVTHN